MVVAGQARHCIDIGGLGALGHASRAQVTRQRQRGGGICVPATESAVWFKPKIRRGRRPSIRTNESTCSRKDLANYLGVSLRDTNQSLRRARWGPPPLLPPLQSTLGNTHRFRKWGLR